MANFKLYRIYQEKIEEYLTSIELLQHLRCPPPSPTATTSHTTHEEPPIGPTPTNLSSTRFQSKIGD